MGKSLQSSYACESIYRTGGHQSATPTMDERMERAADVEPDSQVRVAITRSQSAQPHYFPLASISPPCSFLFKTAGEPQRIEFRSQLI